MIPKKGQLTIRELLNLKGKRQIIMTTARDTWIAAAAQAAGVDIIATGGTGGATENYENVAARVQLIRKAAPNVLLSASVPIHLDWIGDEEAIRWGVNLLRAGADVVYAQTTPERIAAMTKQGIPCRAHVGLVPVVSTMIGGLRAVGKDSKEAIKVYKDAVAYEQAGAVCLEMECVPSKVASEITKCLKIPVISLGSGSGCDGQYLFSDDILGIEGNSPRHAKKYRDFLGEAIAAFREFKNEAETAAFPPRERRIEIEDQEFRLFMEGLKSFKPNDQPV